MSNNINQYENLSVHAKHSNMPQNAPNTADEAAGPPIQAPNQPPNQLCSPQPNGITPAPVSNAGDQQLQAQASSEDEPLPNGWEIRYVINYILLPISLGAPINTVFSILFQFSDSINLVGDIM